MTREEMLEDLAYARALAEEGRHAPLLGGSYLLFWGVLNAAAFGAQWGILTGALPALGGDAFGLLWLSYGLLSTLGMTLLRLRVCKKPGLTSVGGRAERAVWTGAAIAVLAIAIGSIGRMLMEQDPAAPNVILGAAFALYGAALFAVARMSEQMWLRAFGWLSVSVAGTVCLFANQPWAYLIASAGSLLVLAWPGVVLLKREPSNIV